MHFIEGPWYLGEVEEVLSQSPTNIKGGFYVLSSYPGWGQTKSLPIQYLHILK